MSFIYRDFLTPARFELNQCIRLYKRFDKVWGREIIDGVEVYSNKLVFWDGSLRSDKSFKRFLNAAGIEYSKLQNQSYTGARTVYFTLEPNKYKFVPPTAIDVVTNLNSVFKVNDEFELKITYDGRSKRVLESQWKLLDGMDPTKITSYTIDTEGIVNTLHSNPLKYFANILLEPSGVPLTSSNPALSTINAKASSVTPRSTPITTVSYSGHINETLAVLDDNSTFQQQGDAYNTTSSVYQDIDGHVYFTYSYNIKYKVINSINTGSYIVNQILIIANALKEASEYSTYTNLYTSTNIVTDTSIKEVVVKMSGADVDNLTYQGHLIVENVADMRKKEFVKMFSKIIGTAYTRKSTKWYQKLLAVVLVIIAIVIAVASFSAASQVSSALVALAAGLAAGSTVISLGLLVYAAVFPTATDVIRIIGKVAQIVGYVSLVVGVMSIIHETFNKMAEQAVKKQVVDKVSNYTVRQYMVDMLTQIQISVKASLTEFVTTITDPSKWSIGSLSSVTLNDVSGWMTNLAKAFQTYMKFFGDTKPFNTPVDKEQASKEAGVEGILLAHSMIDNVDALQKLNGLIKNNFGGQKTENFMQQII